MHIIFTTHIHLYLHIQSTLKHMSVIQRIYSYNISFYAYVRTYTKCIFRWKYSMTVIRKSRGGRVSFIWLLILFFPIPTTMVVALTWTLDAIRVCYAFSAYVSLRVCACVNTLLGKYSTSLAFQRLVVFWSFYALCFSYVG